MSAAIEAGRDDTHCVTHDTILGPVLITRAKCCSSTHTQQSQQLHACKLPIKRLNRKLRSSGRNSQAARSMSAPAALLDAMHASAALLRNLSGRQALPQGWPEGCFAAALPHHTRSQQAGGRLVLQHVTLSAHQLRLLLWQAPACRPLLWLQTACPALLLPLGLPAPLHCLGAAWPGSQLLHCPAV